MAGYKTLQHLARANVEELVKQIEHLPRKQARQIVSAAKVCSTTVWGIPMNSTVTQTAISVSFTPCLCFGFFKEIQKLNLT